jgi:uncharacterized membrane protein YbaN (DUF454 family)
METDLSPESNRQATTPRPWVRLVRWVSGIALLLLGITGLILPIMPGWVFILPGIALLGTVTPRVRLFLRAIRNRIPRRLGPVWHFFHRLQALARRKKPPVHRD